ncbi:MAG: tetratricopeptide repeat protein [Planctomycetes bacterium]|nr:tetratricopeptide repeat protein [Planctomycetota bacterium]
MFFLTFTLSTFGLVISALALFRPTHRRGIALLALILNSLVMFPVLLALWGFSTDTSSAQVDQGQPDYDEIIEDLTIAIQTNPNNSIFYRHRGYAYVQKRDFDSAIQDLTEAIRLEPDLASMYQERGQAYLQKGDREKALADFARAREIRLLEANPH